MRLFWDISYAGQATCVRYRVSTTATTLTLIWPMEEHWKVNLLKCCYWGASGWAILCEAMVREGNGEKQWDCFGKGRQNKQEAEQRKKREKKSRTRKEKK